MGGTIAVDVARRRFGERMLYCRDAYRCARLSKALMDDLVKHSNGKISIWDLARVARKEKDI